MTSVHYSGADAVRAFRDVGLRPGDLVFCHSNIGFFGIPEAGRNTEAACRTLIEALFAVIGSDGTLVVPTFTYSFAEGKPYEAAVTPSRCGAFAEYVRRMPAALRSADPCFSVAALGARAADMTGYPPDNSYAEDSFFGRFHRAGGVICNWNFDAGSTFVHYVERCLRVPYRFDKTFAGTLLRDGRTETRSNTIWVRYLSSEGTTAEFSRLDQLARAQGLYRTVPLGRGFVGRISAADTFNLIERTLPDEPWFLTRAGLTGEVPVLTPEATHG